MTKNAETKFGSLSWVEVVPDSSDCPSSRSGHTLIYFEECLYLFGGKDEYSASNELWQYHVAASVWTKLSYSGKAPPRLFNHSAVLYDRKFFIFGGSLGSSFSLWVFDFSVFQWEKYSSREDWPLNRHSQSVTLLNNHVYMFGGYTYLGNESNELWKYELDEDAWYKVSASNSPPAMFGHTAVFSGPILWIFGGSSEREILDSLWSYDTEMRNWNRLVRVFSPPPLYYHIAIITGDVMLIYGGFDEGVKPYRGMWRFNFEVEEWTQMVSTELPGLAGHAVAVSYIKSAQNGLFSEKCISQATTDTNKFYRQTTTENNNNNCNNNNSVPRDNGIHSNQSHDNGNHGNHSFDNLGYQATVLSGSLLNESSSTVVAHDSTIEETNEDTPNYGSTWDDNEVVLFDKNTIYSSYQQDNGYLRPQLYAVNAGDIELRPMTTKSTNSADSHVSLPGMVDDDDEVVECDYTQRVFNSVYENMNVSPQLKPGFCVNNPLFNESLAPEKPKPKTKPKPAAITFYDTEVTGDPKHDQSDSGSQGSRSSLRKKKQYKRGCNTEFYIAGHGQETLAKSVVLYRCKIV